MARVDTTWWYHNWRLDWCGNFNGWRLNRDKLNSWVISSHSNLYGFMISFCLWLAAPVCHPPPPPPICLFHTSNIVRWLNELEDCQNNRHVDFILFFASNSVWWIFGEMSRKGKKVFLHLVADVCRGKCSSQQGSVWNTGAGTQSALSS